MHVFCHAVPGHVARDGRDALGRGLAALAARRRRRATSPRSSPRPSGGRPAARGCSSRRTSTGERTPHADPDARGAFVGLSLRHDRGALVRAVLEGVAYGLRDSFELLRELGVRPARSGAISGGGARSELWLEIVAAVLGLPLERLRSRRALLTALRCLPAAGTERFADPREAVAAASA